MIYTLLLDYISGADQWGEGTYDKVKANMKAYNDYCEEAGGELAGIMPAKLSIDSVLQTAQIHAEPGMAVKELARELNISHVKFRPMLPLGRALSDDRASLESIRAYLSPLELMKQGFSPVASCGIGQNLCMEPSGESFPCYAYHKPHAFLGNVFWDSLETVLQSEKRKLLQTHRWTRISNAMTVAYGTSAAAYTGRGVRKRCNTTWMQRPSTARF